MGYNRPYYIKFCERNPGLKPCGRCCTPIPVTGQSRCEPCMEFARQNWNEHYQRTRKKRLARYRKYHQANRDSVILAYGGKCSHCENNNPLVLQLDHIHNDGYEERKKVKGTAAIYRKVVKEGFPKDRYQLLCANCNWCKGMYGIYPDGTELTGTS